MAVELDELSGDVADLIGYHRGPTGLVHDDDIAKLITEWNIQYIGSVNIEITSITAPFDAAIQKTLAEIPIPKSGDRWLTYMPPPECGASAWPPPEPWVDPFTYEEPSRWTRRQVAFAITAALIVAVWVGIGLLFAFGVIDAANNGGTTR